MKMNIHKGLCFLVVLTAAAVQPALAAEAPSTKVGPSVQTIQLADIPMRKLAAEPSSAGEIQATRRDNVGYQVGEFADAKVCPGGGNATFTWKITDDCSDGAGIYVRFFDETNNLVFPNSTQAYVINSGRTSTIKLTVKRGAKICYGAEPTDLDGSYWGVGLDNTEGCASCCNIVPNSGNLTRSVRLICS